MTELSDAEVFGAPPPSGEMSDADVFGASEPTRGGANPADLAERGLSVSTAGKDFVNSTSAGSIMRAFGQGFGEAWGPEKLGLSADTTKWLSEKGIFAPAGAQKFENPFHAFNEGIIVPAAIGLDASWRTLGGIFRGAQETAAKTGEYAEDKGVPGAKSLGRDIAAMPEAFMGSLHPTGMPGARVAEAARAETLRMPKAPPGIPEGLPRLREAPTQSAEAGGQFIEAYHGSPHDFEKFNSERIGTGEGAQTYGHGLYLAENKKVAEEYYQNFKGGVVSVHLPGGIENLSSHPTEFMRMAGRFIAEAHGDLNGAISAAKAKIDGGGLNSFLADDLASAVSQMEKWKDKSYPIEFNDNTSLYQVRVNADPALFLDWDKPLGEQSMQVQVALKQAGIASPADLEALSNKSGVRQLKFEDSGNGIYHALAESLTDFNQPMSKQTQMAREAAVTQRLNELGIAGIKYLDQGSRAAQDALSKSSHPEDLIRPEPTRNLVVFDDKAIEITHKNGVPVPTVADARELGVVGPEKPPLSEGKPAEAVQARTMAADRVPDEKITQEMGAQPDAWQQRFEQFVGKLESPEDVKQLIRDSAKENGDFMPARQGDIPLGQVEDIATAAGVSPSEINIRGLGRNLKNDAEVRTAMQMMLQVTDNVKDAARELKAADTPENLIKLQEAVMRRDLAVEQVVGLRAEWGRTGNVFQEFQRRAKEDNGLSDFLKERGRSPDDLRGLADSIDNLDKTQAARLLNDLRTPTAWDKFRYYWVNALISGPITHAKYIIANAAFAGYEAAVVTPVAGTIGAVRRGLTATNEGVFLGEAPARVWGIVAGVPDAIKAAVQAGKTALQTPLPGEIAQNIIPKQNRNIAFQQRPIEGVTGAVIGIPSRGASAIHSFFNFMGYRASIEAQAYRQAAKEGLKPNSDAFWQRRAAVADAPTVDMMNSGIEEGYKLTFISELGETGRKLSSFVNSTKVGQLVMPFVHIPLNILKRSLEGTPAAFLDAETRDALMGRSGAVKQDQAAARLIAGGAVGAWAINQTLNDRMTGFGPSDPKERAQWLATGHQPYSIRIGDEWYSFNRFGPLGTMLGLYSNLSEAIPHIKPDSEELTKALTMTIHSTGRLMEDEVGMQGLAGLMDAINEPDRKGTRFVSNFAGSLLPFSSFLRQTASAMDPYMRETKSVVDGLRYYIPNVRQNLAPKRDWLGLPIANAGYGGDLPVPGASAIIQHRDATVDPVNLEMKTLDLHPAPPQDRIKGVKLPAKLYDTYQATAGPFTHQVLSQYVNSPGWHDIPISARQEVVRSTIRATREAAQAAMQMSHPELIQQGVQDRIDKINGVKPTKMKD